MFHEKHRDNSVKTDRTAAQDALARFESLLADRAVRLGLISEGDRDRIRTRHIDDSLRAAALVKPEDRSAYDLGSGAGLPGIVVAIAAPHLHVLLVETRRKAVAFLEFAVQQLELQNVRVVRSRIEDLGEPADICFARALAPVEDAWRLATPLLVPGGRLVYFGGTNLRATRTLTGARSVRTVKDLRLESSGPLVIISRE